MKKNQVIDLYYLSSGLFNEKIYTSEGMKPTLNIIAQDIKNVVISWRDYTCI